MCNCEDNHGLSKDSRISLIVLFKDPVIWKHCIPSAIEEWLSLEHRWNGTDRGVWGVGGMILIGECGALVG
jgi:hypothetical protein